MGTAELSGAGVDFALTDRGVDLRVPEDVDVAAKVTLIVFAVIALLGVGLGVSESMSRGWGLAEGAGFVWLGAAALTWGACGVFYWLGCRPTTISLDLTEQFLARNGQREANIANRVPFPQVQRVDSGRPGVVVTHAWGEMGFGRALTPGQRAAVVAFIRAVVAGELADNVAFDPGRAAGPAVREYSYVVPLHRRAIPLAITGGAGIALLLFAIFNPGSLGVLALAGGALALVGFALIIRQMVRQARHPERLVLGAERIEVVDTTTGTATGLRYDEIRESTWMVDRGGQPLYLRLSGPNGNFDVDPARLPRLADLEAVREFVTTRQAELAAPIIAADPQFG